MKNELCLGFDLIGPYGPFPNCLNPNYLTHVYENADSNYDKQCYPYPDGNIPSVFIMRYYRDYSISKSVYNIIEDRKAGNVYDWFYIIEPFSNLKWFFNPENTDKKTNLEFISELAINEIKNHSGKILINYVVDGGESITKKNFLKLKNFLDENDISHSKVYLVFQDFLLGKVLKKELDLNVNFYAHEHFILAKSNEFNKTIEDPNYDYWRGAVDPQVGKVDSTQKSTILLHDEFKENIKSEKKDFLVFTRQWKFHRLLLLDLLYELGLDKSLVSWNKDKYTPSGVEEFSKICKNKDLIDLMKSTDRVLDWKDITKVTGYGFESKELYLNSYLSIVTESLYFQGINHKGDPHILENIVKNKNGKNIDFISGFISEKIWKPIGHSHPFILIGPPSTLKYMKERFGFKTFDKWLDESYDLEFNDWKRWEKIRKVIRDFSTKTVEEKQQFLIDVSPILEHNQNVFLSLDANKYKGEVVNFLQG